MKTYIRIIIMCLLALPFAARAQVSIGTLSPIEPAALLQLGDYVAKNQGDTTSVSGGLLLPRIVLTDLNKVTVIPESSSSDKKIDLTGLLVYNIGTGNGISEGLYEWDGYKWLPLESESQTVGSNTKKSVKKCYPQNFYYDSDAPVVSMGIFEFRIQPTGSELRNQVPQIRHAGNHPNINIRYHISCYWDRQDYGITPETGDEKNNINAPYCTHVYESKTLTPYGWTNLVAELPNAGMNVRYDLWLADIENNKLYNVLFMIATYDYSSKDFEPTAYVVIVTEY